MLIWLSKHIFTFRSNFPFKKDLKKNTNSLISGKLSPCAQLGGVGFSMLRAEFHVSIFICTSLSFFFSFSSAECTLGTRFAETGLMFKFEGKEERFGWKGYSDLLYLCAVGKHQQVIYPEVSEIQRLLSWHWIEILKQREIKLDVNGWAARMHVTTGWISWIISLCLNQK